MEFLRVSSTADLRPRRVSAKSYVLFRFQSVYVSERAPPTRHGPRATGGHRHAGGGTMAHSAQAQAAGVGRSHTRPAHTQDQKVDPDFILSYLSLIHKIFVQHSRVLHSNAEIRTHQTCHLLMLTRVTESPIVEAPHERADHDAVACLALPAIAHAEDASVVGATGPF